MKDKWLITLAMLAFASTAVAGHERLPVEPGVYTVRVDGELFLGSDGHVQDYRVRTAVQPAELAAKIVFAVKALEFVPVMHDGHTVASRMQMRVTLAGEPDSTGALKVHLDNITFPSEGLEHGVDFNGKPRVVAEVTKKLAPVYPEYPADADVLVAVRMGLDGSIQEATVRQSTLLNVRGRPEQIAPVLAAFESVSLSALRRWKVRVQVPPGMTPSVEDLSALVPVSFRMPGSKVDRAGHWVFETRSAKRPEPWLTATPGESSVGVSDIDGDRLVDTNSGPHLIKPLQFTTL